MLKKRWTIPLFVALAAAYAFFSLHKKKELTPEQRIENTVLSQVHAFRSFISDSLGAAVTAGLPAKQLQRLFLQARLRYKRFEWAAEYFTGSVTRFVNGPPVEEVTTAGPLVQAFQPAGLQVIEGLLFPYRPADSARIRAQLKKLERSCAAYQAYYTHVPIASWQVFDATRLEVFRVMTLGITGFDDPASLNCMNESATALQSVKDALSFYIRQGRDSGLSGELTGAIRFLKDSPGFDSFDRAAFITGYANKVSAGILGLQKQLHIPEIRYQRLLRQDAKTLFDTGAFDADARSPGPGYRTTRSRVSLGERLFHDPVFSATGTRSCASCHQPVKAFTDGLVTNTRLDGKGRLRRNTPTLLAAALQASLFYDLRASGLEEQVHDVVSDPGEMHGSLVRAAALLSGDSSYRKLFAKAYPAGGQTIDTLEITNALACYVRSLTGLDSRFDDYMRGDTGALSAREIKGFNLFMGKAGCGTCHYMPLFNGTQPPKYIRSDAEVLGVPATADGSTLDSDPGWYAVTGVEATRHAFKTPTVRNAAETAPYMHNGVFRTLKEVLDFYNEGGGRAMGLKVDNQTLAADSLHLSETEIAEIIAFIRSLDSRRPPQQLAAAQPALSMPMNSSKR
jgi:cytochrome c peroxidase